MVTCILDKDNGFNISNRRVHTHVPFHLKKDASNTFDLWTLSMAKQRALKDDDDDKFPNSHFSPHSVEEALKNSTLKSDEEAHQDSLMKDDTASESINYNSVN